jgi:hypothetical protein
MKKLLLLLLMALFPLMSFAEGGYNVENVPKYNFLQKSVCPVLEPDKICKVSQQKCEYKCEKNEKAEYEWDREPFSLVFKMPVLVKPDNGAWQTLVMIHEMQFKHSTSDWLAFAIVYGQMEGVKKKKFKESDYGSTWKYQYLAANAELYLTHNTDYNFSIFGGAGSMFTAEDEDEESPSLDTLISYGFNFYLPQNQAGGMNWIASLETKECESKESGIRTILGTASMTMITLGIEYPF